MSDDRLHDPTLSRAYRESATAGPPPALDALILAAARKEAANPAPRVRIPWWRRALAPVGVFATLVVTVSVVLMIEQEQRDLLPASAPAPMSAPPAPVLPEVSRSMENEIARDAAPKAAPVPKQQERLRASAKPSTAPTTAQSYGPAAPAAAPGGIAGRQSRELRSEPAPTPGGAGAAEKKALPEEQSAASSTLSAPVVAPAAAPPAAARSEYKAAGRLEATRAPAEWIEEIRRLRRAGRESEAQAQLAAFRRAYPGYALPDDLKVP